jgi:tetratricopeptide (TPR) repeat protein
MPVSETDLVEEAYRLVALGRADDALTLTAHSAAGAAPSHAVLAARSAALKAAGRWDEAEAAARAAVRLYPESAVAWHNLAALLGDIGRAEDSAEAAGRAIAMGLNGPQTWAVLARAQARRLDAPSAIVAYRRALAQAPADAILAGELSALLWMTTGDWALSVAPLRAARMAGAEDVGLIDAEARILGAAGRAGEVAALYRSALAIRPDDPALLRAAAHAALEAGDLALASARIERALAVRPGALALLIQLASVRMAQGRATEAFEAARAASRIDRFNQAPWGWLAIAARVLGHPVHADLFDYAALVRTYRLEPPSGWPSLEAFLADLSAVLGDLHRFKAAPADQSLRHGTQTGSDLTRLEQPVLKAFFGAVGPQVQRYLAEIGTGPDPVRFRNRGGWRFDDAWSVRLQPQGFHASHYHARGWVSSAFYVELPSEAAARPPEGWLQFGAPPYATAPPLGAEYFVRPEPGLLVLFPSYMWHGTAPFSAGSRLTIAFDLTPD